MVLASLVMVFASIAVFADIYASTNRQTSVLIVTQTIQQGQQLSGSDLGQASVSISSGVSPIPVSDARRTHGQAGRGHHSGRVPPDSRRYHRFQPIAAGMPSWVWR